MSKTTDLTTEADTRELLGAGVQNELERDGSTMSRRSMMAGAGITLGSIGLLGALPGAASAARSDNLPANILNVAATAEVLATIVNTVGAEKVALDDVTKSNIQAAAREELLHYEALVGLGGKAATTTIYVPDEVFASKEGLLTTLVAGDTIFVNAYLLAATVFARAKASKEARYAAEIAAVEAVHRALALQSLGKPANDLAYGEFSFKNINRAVDRLKAAGFGFGEPGSKPGTAYNFDEVKTRTPDPAFVTSRSPA